MKEASIQVLSFLKILAHLDRILEAQTAALDLQMLDKEANLIREVQAQEAQAAKVLVHKAQDPMLDLTAKAKGMVRATLPVPIDHNQTPMEIRDSRLVALVKEAVVVKVLQTRLVLQAKEVKPHKEAQMQAVDPEAKALLEMVILATKIQEVKRALRVVLPLPSLLSALFLSPSPLIPQSSTDKPLSHDLDHRRSPVLSMISRLSLIHLKSLLVAQRFHCLRPHLSRPQLPIYQSRYPQIPQSSMGKLLLLQEDRQPLPRPSITSL